MEHSVNVLHSEDFPLAGRPTRVTSNISFIWPQLGSIRSCSMHSTGFRRLHHLGRDGYQILGGFHRSTQAFLIPSHFPFFPSFEHQERSVFIPPDLCFTSKGISNQTETIYDPTPALLFPWVSLANPKSSRTSPVRSSVMGLSKN
ncbi:hypothetical protein CLF_106279 [Clonorchis sinensis]|uniref:Uncharacterized protein n=1 Tax=Clonorchis sinensis TaxID=79923 RepID=G7YPU5_CLOSI|nr:hypothetical protein CLF_106279 [Clonorchis sinensis]